MSDKHRTYIDNNATSPMREEVLDSMLPYFKEHYGNPSSAHMMGRSIRTKIAEVREVVAGAIGADPSEVFFTSGGTESDNLAIKGNVWADGRGTGTHIITATTEHPAVLETCKYLSKNGYEVTHVPVDAKALVDPEAVREAITDKTSLISIMHANNEVGVIEPIEDISKIAKEKGVTMHTDAVQSFLKIPVNVADLGIDLLSLSAHKVGGPKGMGALYIKKGTKMHPLIHGGHHERGMRAGTENVTGIVGFGKAVEMGLAEMDSTVKHVSSLRDELEKRIVDKIPFVRINGCREKRLPGTVNVSLECVEGEALLINLDLAGIAISTGSACSSGSLDPSHVLMAMGIPHEVIHGSLRFSFGHENTMADVDYVMKKLPAIITTLRRMSPLWNLSEQRAMTVEEISVGTSLHR